MVPRERVVRLAISSVGVIGLVLLVLSFTQTEIMWDPQLNVFLGTVGAARGYFAYGSLTVIISSIASTMYEARRASLWSTVIFVIIGGLMTGCGVVAVKLCSMFVLSLLTTYWVEPQLFMPLIFGGACVSLASQLLAVQRGPIVIREGRPLAYSRWARLAAIMGLVLVLIALTFVQSIIVLDRFSPSPVWSDLQYLINRELFFLHPPFSFLIFLTSFLWVPLAWHLFDGFRWSDRISMAVLSGRWAETRWYSYLLLALTLFLIPLLAIVYSGRGIDTPWYLFCVYSAERGNLDFFLKTDRPLLIAFLYFIKVLSGDLGERGFVVLFSSIFVIFYVIAVYFFTKLVAEKPMIAAMASFLAIFSGSMLVMMNQVYGQILGLTLILLFLICLTKFPRTRNGSEQWKILLAASVFLFLIMFAYQYALAICGLTVVVFIVVDYARKRWSTSRNHLILLLYTVPMLMALWVVFGLASITPYTRLLSYLQPTRFVAVLQQHM